MPSFQPRPQGLLLIQNGGLEKSLAKAARHFKKKLYGKLTLNCTLPNIQLTTIPQCLIVHEVKENKAELYVCIIDQA